MGSPIEIPSEIKYVRKASSEILSALSPFEIAQERLFDIRLCVEEAVRNAIVHGNRLNKTRRVKIAYRIEKGRIYIEVEDEGAGFDPRRVPDPTGDDNIFRESGRGICLIRNLMDKVDFNEKGNRIMMEKGLR